MIELHVADTSRKPLLANLMDHYLSEMFQTQNLSRSEIEKLGPYPYFELYWTEAERVPYVFIQEGVPIGFAFVRLGQQNEIAEFYVVPKYRRSGLGNSAAKQLFDRYHGNWKISVLKENQGAAKFWRETILAYFPESFAESWPHKKPVGTKFFFRN